jgi:hypothetical protein
MRVFEETFVPTVTHVLELWAANPEELCEPGRYAFKLVTGLLR